ncbi:MAG: M23 family metallopeptidase [Mobilitalea sp.]
MEITFLPKDYIITTCDPYCNVHFSDFMLRALRIKNETNVMLELQNITFSLKKNGQVIKEYVYSCEALNYWIPQWEKNIHISDNQIEALIGVKKFWDYNCLSTSTRLEPGQEIGLRNEYFHIVCPEFLDELIVQVTYTQAGITHKEYKNITLIRYENKNKYIFPVKGTWQVCGNFDCIGAHRQRNSDEFAFDLTILDKSQKLLINNDKKSADYPCYGEKVYAIADGKVVRVYNEMDRNTIGISKEEEDKLISLHGYWPIITGNVVAIQHDNGEYSAVDHLQYHSITLKVGDSVKQGQVIGLVGNTGLSGCPHLHFELKTGINSDDRSLPCSFTNIYNIDGNSFSIIAEEYTIVHAE